MSELGWHVCSRMPKSGLSPNRTRAIGERRDEIATLLRFAPSLWLLVLAFLLLQWLIELVLLSLKGSK